MLLNGGKNDKKEQVLPKDAVDDIFDGSELSRKQHSLSFEGSRLRPVTEIRNTTHFPELPECEQFTPDWSYRGQFRSYNPGGRKGTGEIAFMDGFYGQFVYFDRKADLVVVQLSNDRNYELQPLNQYSSFVGLSSYFRCNK